jgi:hypothetical protein
LKAEKLQTVGGNLYIYSNAELKAENLQTVGGNLYIYSNTELKAPKLKQNQKPTKAHFNAIKKAKLHAAKNCERQGYLLADGILQRIVSKKKTTALTVYKTKHLVLDDVNYVVFNGEHFSHGKTLKQAKDDLMFKLTKRDLSEFKKLNVNKKLKLSELISIYRNVTGACETGVKSFVKSIDAKSSYTIKEVFKLTKGQYGSDKFAEFFNEN